MRKINVMVGRFFVFLLAVTSMSGRAWGTTYGWTDVEGQATDETKIAYYNTNPIILGDGDSVVAIAALAGGFHTAAIDCSVTFSNVTSPIAKDIYLRSGAHINFEGDLTLSTTSIEADGPFMINGGPSTSSQTLFLDKNLALPARSIVLTNNLTIDGLGHTVTFDNETIFAINGKWLTLKNMVIKGLNGSNQFLGSGSVTLQNCIVDIPSGITFTYNSGNPNLYIVDDVLIQGGGTFQFGGSGNFWIGNAINDFATLCVDQDTTLDYLCTANNLLNLGQTSSTIHLNGGTLKAITGDAGLQLLKGRLFLDGKCTLQTGSSGAKGLQFGDGEHASDDLTVKVLPGAQVQVNGYVWHNSDVTV